MSIEAIASAIPSIKHTAQELALQTGAEEQFIRDKVGLNERFVLGPGETGLSLAAAACAKLFGNCELAPEQVDLLVYVTQNPDRRIPHNAPQLAEKLGLPKSCASFDLSLGCSGFAYGLNITEAFLLANRLENALLVTCDPYSRIMAAEDKATNAVFGDAAAACWITASGTRTRTTGYDFGTDGSGGDAIRIDAGGAAAPLVALDIAEGVAGHTRDALRLRMDGRGVFNFVNAQIPQSIAASLAKAGLQLADIDFFALHQGSYYMLKTLANRVGIPDDKLLVNIAAYGNTVSSTIPMLLEELLAKQEMRGKRVLFSGFGVGLSWATGILEFSR